ncbi:MAG: hypothetical protein M0Z30_21345 [Actinomycetota bacterium]|nr:hypothetical protein [Actinomycetota bacterium]
MSRALRLGAFAGALAAGSLGLSACDASPYAATVNGYVITVNSLQHQLAGWSANKAWVQQFDSGNSTAQGGSGATVVGSGGSGTYSSAFAADILGDLVATKAIEQYLGAHRITVTADQTVASRAVNEYIRSGSWTQFSPSIREFQVRQLAEEGALAPVPTSTSNLQTPYTDIQSYLFSSLCVDQESTANRSEAQSAISSGTVTGGEICYDQISLEDQPAAYQAALRKLTNPGDLTGAIATSYGFVVAKLVSRDSPGFSPGVQQVLSAAVSTPTTITSVLSSAKVKVNPRYGTWSGAQVTPPKAPPSS